VRKRAYVVRVNGSIEKLAKCPTLSEAQSIIGGYIELLKVDGDKTLIVDEDGKLRGKLINQSITSKYGFDIPGGYIVGDVIVLEGWKDLA